MARQQVGHDGALSVSRLDTGHKAALPACICELPSPSATPQHQLVAEHNDQQQNDHRHLSHRPRQSRPGRGSTPRSPAPPMKTTSSSTRPKPTPPHPDPQSHPPQRRDRRPPTRLGPRHSQDRPLPSNATPKTPSCGLGTLHAPTSTPSARWPKPARPAAMAAIDARADQVHSNLTGMPAWPTLRMHLAMLAVDGHDPSSASPRPPKTANSTPPPTPPRPGLAPR